MVWPKGKKKRRKKRGKLTKEQRERIGAAVRQAYSNHPVKKKGLSIRLKKLYSNPAERKKLSRFIKKYFSTHPGAREKDSKAIKKYFSNPSARLKTSRARRKFLKEHPDYYKNPKLLKKIDRAITKWWREHPNIRKERSEAAKKFFIANPDKFKKFIKYGKSSSFPHLKTKQGFLVRSKGEQKIANFLSDNKIKSEYESKTLIFKEEGQICVPDFYLPHFKTYIEFYGGYPEAWKKKVMKNKLYKKYKIPCIFITPAELRDLNYYLKGELKK